MGTTHQPRVQAGIPSGGQFAHGQAGEPASISLFPTCRAADENDFADVMEEVLAETSGRMTWDDMAGGELWKYRGQIWHPKACVERLIKDRVASPAARDADPTEVLGQILQANGINSDGWHNDLDDGSEWDTDEFPRAIAVSDIHLGNISVIVGEDGKQYALYRAHDDIPLDIPGLSPRQCYTATLSYRSSATGSEGVMDGREWLEDGRTADDFVLSTEAVQELNREAAEIWSSIPEELRTEVVESGVDIDNVFHSLRLSATGQGVGLWGTRGLAQRVHDSIQGTPVQQTAEYSRIFRLNDDGELDYSGYH